MEIKISNITYNHSTEDGHNYATLADCENGFILKIEIPSFMKNHEWMIREYIHDNVEEMDLTEIIDSFKKELIGKIGDFAIDRKVKYQEMNHDY